VNTTEETPRPPRPELAGPGANWRGLSIRGPAWREDQPPERNETVPAGKLPRDLVALALAALIAGLGLKLILAGADARAQMAGAVPRAAPALRFRFMGPMPEPR